MRSRCADSHLRSWYVLKGVVVRKNSVKERLRAGGVAIGVISGITSETAVELCGYAGFDFIIFDAEHAPINEQACESLVRAAEVAGITPLVRVAGNDPKLILRFLDTGSLGVMVPQINTAEEAQDVVRAARYFPQGSRGLGPVRAANYAQTISMEEYTEEANRQILVIIQIEDIAALENLDEILAVEGVDVIAIGPRDLSKSMGFPGQYDHPEVRKAIDKIIESVTTSDKALAMPASDADSAARVIQRGAQIVILGMIPLLINAGKTLLFEVRGDKT